jgi:hypothetical protein
LRTWIKRSLLVVVALLAAALLLVLAWVASNWRDADPQPWPEALTPRAMAVADADNFFITLTAVPAPDIEAPRLTLPPCTGADCVAVWRTAAPQWAAQRQAHAALGAVCEAGTSSGVPASAEPLPATFRIDDVWPRFQNLTGCSAWLLTLALEASSANQPDTAVAKLAQSARLGTAVFNGSQSLIGHMIALAVWNRHLQALQVVAAQHPGTVAALQALPLPTAAQTAAAQRRWIAYEASFNRGIVGMASSGEACRAEVGFSAWHCRSTAALSLPNYSEQLFSTHWQQVLATIRDDGPLSAVEYLEQRTSAPPSGLFGSLWHWRGTVAHVLFEVALPGYKGYFARSANLVLSAQATRLWLGAQGQSTQSRSGWLAAQVKGTPLAGRLNIDNQGLWQLRALDDTASATGKATTRWPALPD